MTLRVKLEIVPLGDEARAYEIGRLDIFNKGIPPGFSEPTHWRHYGAINLSPDEEGMYDLGVLHSRAEGAWALVRRILTDLPVFGPWGRGA